MSKPESPRMRARRERWHLASDLAGLGDEFFVFEDITTSALPVRPTKKRTIDWTWEDCHRALWWGLAKRGHKPGQAFRDVVMSVAAGRWDCLPAAADLLEEDGIFDEDLLTLMRKVR